MATPSRRGGGDGGSGGAPILGEGGEDAPSATTPTGVIRRRDLHGGIPLRVFKTQGSVSLSGITRGTSLRLAVPQRQGYRIAGSQDSGAIGVIAVITHRD